jgi:hypothetical protein
MRTISELRPGMEVVAGGEGIGELLGTIAQGDVSYLHVRRFGAGMDDLFIPSIVVENIAPKHVYLRVAPEDLLGQAWHDYPGVSAKGKE